MKICVIGYSGSGKSTLARKLSEQYGIEALHMDTVQFLPGWEVREAKDKERIVGEFLDTHDSWVIDGNYKKLSFFRRTEEADRIILLLFGRFSCLLRVIRRYRKFRNRTRPDMAEGCNEKLDAEFIKWVLWKGRTKKTRELFESVVKMYPGKSTVIRNQKQLDVFYEKLKGE